MKDYFEHLEETPEAIQVIAERTNENWDMDSYDACEALMEELKEHGWTCDYGLDGVPFGLQPITKEDSYERQVVAHNYGQALRSKYGC
jgi:hypothetical protein